MSNQLHLGPSTLGACLSHPPCADCRHVVTRHISVFILHSHIKNFTFLPRQLKLCRTPENIFFPLANGSGSDCRVAAVTCQAIRLSVMVVQPPLPHSPPLLVACATVCFGRMLSLPPSGRRRDPHSPKNINDAHKILRIHECMKVEPHPFPDPHNVCSIPRAIPSRWLLASHISTEVQT